jgi:hypothetical protein
MRLSAEEKLRKNWKILPSWVMLTFAMSWVAIPFCFRLFIFIFIKKKSQLVVECFFRKFITTRFREEWHRNPGNAKWWWKGWISMPSQKPSKCKSSGSRVLYYLFLLLRNRWHSNIQWKPKLLPCISQGVYRKLVDERTSVSMSMLSK